jgi:hypothetical protein
MKILIQHLVQVLTSDPALTGRVKPENIGTTVRQPAGSPCIEVDLAFQERDPDGKQNAILRFYIHSQKGSGECHEIAELLHPLMTAVTLSRKDIPPGSRNGYKADRVRQTDAVRMPRNDWAASLLLEYSVKLTELQPIHQHQ